MRNDKSIGNPEVLRNLNKSRVLNVVRDFGPMSRSAVANHTKLGWGSVGKYVDELLRDGLLLETGPGEATGGRRSILLKVNRGAGFFLGAMLGSHTTRVALIDFKGRIHSDSEHRTNADDPKDKVLELLLERMKKELGAIDRKKLVAVGIGVSGEVDSKRGIIINAGNFADFKNVDLRTALSEAFNADAFVVNKLTAMTLGEMTYGAGKELDDFICVSMGGGIGSGIVSMGRFVWPHPLRGIGDIGHMTLDKNGPMCACGFRGCLDAFAGGKALEKRIAETAPEIEMESLTPDIVAANPQIAEIAASAGNRIGEGVAAVVQAYHPEKVVLNGRLLNLGSPLVQGIKDEVERTLHRGRFAPEDVVVSPLLGTAGPLGAASYAWDELYHHKIEYA